MVALNVGVAASAAKVRTERRIVEVVGVLRL
jgi:hypothetical protein